MCLYQINSYKLQLVQKSRILVYLTNMQVSNFKYLTFKILIKINALEHNRMT